MPSVFLEKIMKRGLMPRIGDSHYSRDYYLVVPCECVSCPANARKFCSMPSAIKISFGGACETRILLLDLNKKLNKFNDKQNKGYKYKHDGD